MFKYLAIRRYQKRLVPILKRRFPETKQFTASQIRTVVYQEDFSPKLLPLGYMMLLSGSELSGVLDLEFPELDTKAFMQENQLTTVFTRLPVIPISA